MNRDVIGIEGARIGAFAAGAARWTRDLQRLTLVVLIGVIVNLASSESARADDLAGLLRTAAAEGAVPALVTAQRTADAGETSPGTGTPVLVVIDDEDRTVVMRSSDIAKRTLEALAGSMQHYGLRMVDAESVARDLDRDIPDRIAKRELLDILEEMGESDKAEHVHHAWVLLRLHARARMSLDTASLRIGVSAQIFMAPGGLLLNSFEPPPERIPMEPGCMESRECIVETVSEHAKLIMPALAEKLHATLEPLLARPEPVIQPGRYVLTLRNFPEVETHIIAGIVTNEFPGHRSLDLIRKSPEGTRTYEYLTDARAAKLDEWFAILLRDMGYDTGGDVTVTLDAGSIVIERLAPPASGDERN